MTPSAIIWDFDGTLYPLQPYDSEQTLLLLRLNQLKHSDALLKRPLIRMLIHADMQQWFTGHGLRKIYSRLYGWCLKGTHKSLLDRTAVRIAATIPDRDRQALRRLNAAGFHMHVISCGTLDLCERVLSSAGLRGYFSSVQANRLCFKGDRVAGLQASLITAHDKLRAAAALNGGSPRGLMAVGDGYTDIPLLDWVESPVMIAPDNPGKSRYASRSYCFVPSVEAVQNLLL